MFHAFRQAIRGCGYLPHVGSHPGTPMLAVMVFAGFGAGFSKDASWIRALIGAIFMLVSVGSLYLCGAYSRAQINDQVERDIAAKEERKKWLAGAH